MKKLITIFFGLIIAALSIGSCLGQTNYNGRIYKFNNVSSLNVADTSSSAITVAADGYMWYDVTSNNFRAKKKNGTKFTIGQSGSSSGAFWPLTGTGTLTGNVLMDGDGHNLEFADYLNIDFNATNGSFLGRWSFQPSANFSGFSAGTHATDPVTTVNSDLWYNTLTSRYRGHTVGANVDFITTAGNEDYIIPGNFSITTTTGPIDFTAGPFQAINIVGNSIVLQESASGLGNYLSVSGGGVLSQGTLIVSGGLTSPTISMQGRAGDPTGSSDGSLWYNTSTNKFRVRQNGADVDMISTATGDMLLGTAQTVTAKKTFTPSASTPSLNFGSIAGNPTTPSNGDVWYNTSAASFMARQNSVTNPIAMGSLTAGRVPYAVTTGTGALTDESVFTYNATTDLLSVPSATHSTALTASYLTAAQIPYAGTAGLISGENALQYNSTLNLQTVTNVAGTAITSLFGGEIQLDDVPNSDDLTLTPISIIGTGGASFSIGTVSTALTVKSSSGDLSVTAVGGLAQGTYTPTLANQVNVSSGSCGLSSYVQIGKSISIAGSCTITPTGAGALSFTISQPIAGTITNCDGVATDANLAQSMAIYDNSNTLKFENTAALTGTKNYYFNFIYTIN